MGHFVYQRPLVQPGHKQQHRKGGGSDSGVIKPRPIGFSSDIKGSPQGPLFPQEVFIEQFEALKQPSGLYFIQQMIQLEIRWIRFV